MIVINRVFLCLIYVQHISDVLTPIVCEGEIEYVIVNLGDCGGQGVDHIVMFVGRGGVALRH
jgi:hypothetical protein